MTNRFDWKPSISVMLPDFCGERMLDLRNNGIEFMELTGCRTDEFDGFDIRSKEIFKTASDFGVTIRSVHLPFYPTVDPASEIEDRRRLFVDMQSELLKICADKGAQIAVVHPSSEPYTEEKRSVNLDFAIDSLGKINEVARTNGIKLAIENLPRSCIARDSIEIRKIAKALPDAYFCFDSNHSLIDSNLDIITAMGSRIIATHISDYEFIDEMHLFPGEGKCIWQDIMKKLEEVNYQGTWNYEIKDCSSIPAKKFKSNFEDLLSGRIL